MANIKFSYRYRDSCNYKNYSYVVFSNPQNATLQHLEELIRSKLIYGEWFYANEWQLPDLFTNHFDPYDDPTWHEFESIAYTDEPPNTSKKLAELICCINEIEHNL
ncbi:hypothetical protein FO440_05190 [Mucilaginibacter corticis]|uniref:Uncharacterized protein n=1 Tax=Mucilaginibacter corticis TaxID=2597670 RepID=A0A556MUK5_9SPHI|nr:hypothetical protein [Mucilaginibacter corticis]TSJ43587.1 hypothetical protein FO440_05190 [Mucilaginibacter corticis]